ncbi:BH0509 family protein [Bacillus lacus]|uniref:BH0509 family protein n=1 Tax=Metabacillus lacus TaxID=1983721 RepID=A0A7X2M176_9BACI|nr:BH0509 family protein [Metabacillus lacus]MRX74347.1 BH0509 family protein [Metabacillus lacus]
MSRQERKNMVEFIFSVKEFDHQAIMYMTDEEIEHIYLTAYQTQTLLSE